MIVDCKTGFVLGFTVCTGANTNYQKFGLGITGDIIAHFLEPYFYKGHVMYVHNQYTSPTLADFLDDRDIAICGTVRANRKGMPDQDNKLHRGEVTSARNGILHNWKKHYKSKEDIIKPTYIYEYNLNMGSIDNIDRQLSITEMAWKTMRWYRKLFFHRIDLRLTNAHALYKIRNENPMLFPSFRLEVVRSLLNFGPYEKLTPNNDSPIRLIGRYFPEQTIKRRCHLCTLRGEKSRTSYICDTCDNVRLCIVPCFKIYHTKAELP